MNTRKTIPAMFLFTVMLLSACGRSAASTVEESPAESVAAVVTEAPAAVESESAEEPTEAPTEAPTETPAPEAMEEVTAGIPQAVFARFYDVDYRGEESPSSHTRYDVVNLTEDSAKAYPALEAALQNFSDERRAHLEEIRQKLDDMTQHLEGEADAAELDLYEATELLVRRADASVFSLALSGDSYTGGAHGFYWREGYSFDAQSGERIALSDLIVDEAALRKALAAELEKFYPNVNWAAPLEEQLEQWDVTPSEEAPAEGEGEFRFTYNWVLDPQGVSFFFNPYELASFADGDQEVAILFSQYPEVFSDRYKQSAETFALSFNKMEGIKLDLDGDGTADELYSYADNVEGDYISNLHVFINGEEFIDEESLDAYSYAASLLHMDNENTFLYLIATSDNDWQATHIYKIGVDGMKRIGWVPGGISPDMAESRRERAEGALFAQITDVEDFWIASRTDVLGTMSCGRPYRVGEDGHPEAKTGCDFIFDERELTLKQDASFPEIVEAADGSLTETRQMIELHAGDSLRPIRTNKESWTDCVLADGRQLRVDVTFEEWRQLVQGVEVEEMFDGVMFAG